jgi:hypothetical protein
MRRLHGEIECVGRARFAFGGRLVARLRDEDGIALVMALVIMMALTSTLCAVLVASSASARSSSRTNSGERSYAFAEAGINNALAVLNANYPGVAAYPGDPTLLTPRTTTFSGGSVTWSGTLAGPLSTGSWRYEWDITSTSTVANPTGAGAAPIQRTLHAVVPVVIPNTNPVGSSSPLNWLFSGTDTILSNSVRLATPVYASRDLTLQNTATVAGAAHKLIVGRDLYLTSPQNQVGLVSAGDPRIDEVHVVHQCSSKVNLVLHNCLWDADAVYATTHDNTIPAGIITIPTLTCCSPQAGTIAPADVGTSSTMGFWYQYADLGPSSPCDPATVAGTPPAFESAGNTAIDDSATPVTAVNLTPASSYTCKSNPSGPSNGELSWNAATKVLTVKGTIFIDGSATVNTGGTMATYTGQGTIMLSGTFDMKNSSLCAVVSGTGCNLTANAWDPNSKALIIVADGDGGGGGAQSQAGDVGAGEGIHLKGANFQGGLIANKTINVETTSIAQGPTISVYNRVLVAQTGGVSYPTIYFAPSGGASITGALHGALLTARSFGG